MNVVEVRGLTKSYGGDQALRGIGLSIVEGETVALLGPNGAGTTTMFDILEGFSRPTAGQVRVLGQDPATAGPGWREGIGIVRQQTAVDLRVTVRQAVAERALSHRHPRPLGEVLEIVGLAGRADDRVGSLSGGELRGLDLAVCVVDRPRLLLLDQPTTGLDPAARRLTWNVVRQRRQAGTTVVFSTHDPEEAEAVADRIVVLAEGVVVAADSPQRLCGRSDATLIRFRLPERFDGAVLPVPALRRGGRWEVHTRTPTRDMAVIAGWALDRRLELSDLEVTRPALQDLYLALVGEVRDVEVVR
jgi:ABC-2 type transport system ATP-binding protein